MTDDITNLFSIGLGPWLTPLRGKIPVLDAWQTLDPVDEATVRSWLETGYNLGFRTGAKSGLVVIDDDQPREGGGDYTPPPTALVAESPTGGRHYYYRAPDPCPGNSASKLAPHVDVRGEGGQVVVPPSVHPLKRRSYRWVSTGEPGVFPAAPTVDMTRPSPAPVASGYAQTALVREAAQVRTCAEGARNDTLNRAAFNLGQLVASGALLEADVRGELLAAASIAGLSESEAVPTIRSGLSAGCQHPREAPAPRSNTATAPPPENPRAADVLVPGAHVLPTGEYVEQGTNGFAAHVLEKVNPESLYRRATTLGEIRDGLFSQCTVNRLRSIIDDSVRLTSTKPPKGDDDVPEIVYRTCVRDHAAIVLDYGQAVGGVRELKFIANHPVCVGDDFDFAQPGWNEGSGVYLTETEPITPLPLDEARAVLEDLVHDFPFQTASDRANLFGLLLTPIVRPALGEAVPMHLVLSPIERTGKSKLIELVLGVTITGAKAAASPLPEREEERAKVILSILLGGQSVWHLDNLTEHLGSANLASLITSTEFQARLLGSSFAPTVTNNVTIVGSGNNVHATGEITKRIVPIRLMPDTDKPEDRNDFKHNDLTAFVFRQRPRVLGALLGLVKVWKEAGRPLHSGGFGGFERWTAVIGGIMGAAGYPEWLQSMSEWRGVADDSGEEHKALSEAWWIKWGNSWTPASDVYELAVHLDLYGWLDRSKTERSRRTAFAMRVINRLVGRVISLPDGCGGVRVASHGVGSRRKVRLEPVER